MYHYPAATTKQNTTTHNKHKHLIKQHKSLYNSQVKTKKLATLLQIIIKKPSQNANIQKPNIHNQTPSHKTNAKHINPKPPQSNNLNPQ